MRLTREEERTLEALDLALEVERRRFPIALLRVGRYAIHLAFYAAGIAPIAYLGWRLL